ncbi:MAG: SnoaL-like domain [Solirubrobacterales bacterium]|nr:SnoaL-like domain [Solirubrobacterales bacterium]
MSAEHLGVVALAFERWNQGDYESAAELFAEDAEWHPRLKALRGEVFRGRATIEGMFRRVTEEMELIVNFRRMELAGDAVLVEVFAQRAADNVEDEWFHLFTFRDNQILRVEPFTERDAAIAAAGPGSK